jgi:hypothetical protein
MAFSGTCRREEDSLDFAHRHSVATRQRHHAIQRRATSHGKLGCHHSGTVRQGPRRICKSQGRCQTCRRDHATQGSRSYRLQAQPTRRVQVVRRQHEAGESRSLFGAAFGSDAHSGCMISQNATGPSRAGREKQTSLVGMAAERMGWDYPTLLINQIRAATPLEPVTPSGHA